MSDCVLDVINLAKFQLDSIGSGFFLEHQVAENRYLPLTRGIAVKL